MASFTQLTTEWVNFQGVISAHIPSQTLFEQINVDKPNPPLDELHFLKLVAWSYILFVESFPVLYKQINGSLRTASPEHFKKVSSIYQNIVALRTHQGHNLVASSTSDQQKIKLVTIWKSQNGGNPFDWSNCCTAICSQIIEVLALFESFIADIARDQEDLSKFTNDIVFAIERKWEAYHFDFFVKKAADILSIENFDVVKYRKSRADDWQKNVEFFSTRKSAEKHISHLIMEELKLKFGNYAEKI